MMSRYLWWIIILAVLVGHFGLNVAIYNRVNGFGWSRKTVKRIVKFFFAFTIAFPPVVVLLYHELLIDLVFGRPDGEPIPLLLGAYSSVCLASWLLLGVPWLLWRPIFGLEWTPAIRQTEVVDVQRTVGRPLALTTRCRLESRLPLNQIFDLAVEQIELPVVGLPKDLDGYRIAHLSDVHLTGHIHPEYSRYAVERATRWNPDFIALTGDIIDSQRCIDWLPEIFSAARAADGCYFVLGNHDTRISDSRQTREAMDRAGWTDLGSRGFRVQLRGVPTLLLGNEHPWFQRPVLESEGDEVFRLLLSHSPDQLKWARQHNVMLMLAGHTHGGQGRLPLAGPVLSPSFHGSRYASGDFYKRPTTMHVSRGLCGTHLMRIHCRPELSLITIRRPDNVADERT